MCVCVWNYILVALHIQHDTSLISTVIVVIIVIIIIDYVSLAVARMQCMHARVRVCVCVCVHIGEACKLLISSKYKIIFTFVLLTYTNKHTHRQGEWTWTHIHLHSHTEGTSSTYMENGVCAGEKNHLTFCQADVIAQTVKSALALTHTKERKKKKIERDRCVPERVDVNGIKIIRQCIGRSIRL